MSLGSNIKKRRFELGLSQQELASLMGYKSRSTIAKIEAGENDVTQRKLSRFAQVLDTSVEALLSGTESAAVPAPTPPPALRLPDEPPRSHHGVIVLAGGKSVRNHQNIPNQFIHIMGKPVIVYCLEAYQNHPAIDDIYVVCLKGWEEILYAYAEQYHITKLRGLIPGGSTGIQSVQNAFEAVRSRYSIRDVLLIQEATRPMVTVDMISKLLQSCAATGSATICQSMRDYVQFTVREGKARYVDRDILVDLQSPEAHRVSVLDSVFRTAAMEHHPMTESCCTMLLYNLGYDINFIEGSVNNIKIVREEDIAIVTSLLKQQMI
ncbi:MAG: XRE family transcriptional regulator [Oscillospiraceae bacterium]|nr:XRE family transcriptional regulator [Oscillospiraceae bacterium]